MQQQLGQQQHQLALKDSFSLKYILGYRSDFKNNIFIHAEQNNYRIIYPAGHNIVLYNNDNKMQQIFTGYNGSSKITAMAQSQSRRWIAWAEEAERAIIVVQQVLDSSSEKTGKRKILSAVDLEKTTKYISLCFSKDEKRIASLTGGPEWCIILWDFHQGKSSGMQKIQAPIQLYHCFFHPKEDDYICIVGNTFLRAFKVTDEGARPKDFFKKEVKDESISKKNFTAFCQLKDDCIIIGTDFGELFLFTNNCELKLNGCLSSSPTGFQIESIIAYSKGFIVGGSNCTLYIFEKHEGDIKNPYQLLHHIANKEIKAKITSMVLTTNEDYLIIGLDNGNIYQISFVIDRGNTEDQQVKFEPVIQRFHTAKITGIDVCIRKALFATCSLDKTVRVWNFQEHATTLEVMKQFDEEAYAIAFHPAGFQLIVAFKEKIRMLNIFEQDLASFKEINVKGCKEIAFSNGGNLFAIVNSNSIQVFNTFTGECPQTYFFRGHSKNVKTIFWQEDDLGFYSGCSDGQVFEFKLENNNQKLALLSISGLHLKSVICSNDRIFTQNEKATQGAQLDRVIYATGIQKEAKNNEEFGIYKISLLVPQKDKEHSTVDQQKKIIVSDPVKVQTGCQISQILMSKSNKLMFFGTYKKDYLENKDPTIRKKYQTKDFPGCVRICRYPLSESTEIYEIQSHEKPITKLKVTYDDNFVFSTGEDGVICIYEIKDRDAKIKRDKDNVGMQYAEEFLIKQEIYQKKILQIEEQKKKIKEMKQQNEKDTKKRMQQKDDQIKQLEDQIQKEAEIDNEKQQTLMGKKKQMEEEFEEEIRQLTFQHEQQKKRDEAEHKQKIALEIQRYEELEREKDQERQEFLELNQRIKDEHQTEIVQKKKEYEELISIEIAERDELYKKKKGQEDEFEGEKAVIEEEAELQIEEIKGKSEIELKKIEDQLQSAEVAATARGNDFESEAQKLEEKRQKLKGILDEISQYQEKNKKAKKDTDSHAKEIEEREKTIADKTRRIYDLKKKTQELEKFKFVLDYKIKELKRDIGPREEEIAKMREQLSNMNAEVLHFKRTNANLSLIVSDLSLRQKGMKKEYDNLTDVFNENNAFRRAYEQDITECYAAINNFKKLKEKILKLYNKYVNPYAGSEQKVKETKSYQANSDAFLQQRKHLEVLVSSLKEKFQKNMESHKLDNHRIMKENVDLITEINVLKTDKKKMEHQDKSNKLISKLLKEYDQVTQKKGEIMENLTTDKKALDDVIQTQARLLKELNEQIEGIEKQLKDLQNKSLRPHSGVKLPSLQQSQDQGYSQLQQSEQD